VLFRSAAVARLRARRILVNATDRPALCDFTLHAIVDRAPVLIAIGTGGASAGLAKALRQRIEAMLPAGLGKIAEALFAARGPIRARWPDAADRRRAIDAGLSAGGRIDPLSDEASVDRWLAGRDADVPSSVIPIRLRSVDPDDLTLREARLLGQADGVWHRPNIPPAILDRARADAARVVAETPCPAGRPGLWIDLDFA
jgi:uroporphyrin-III C-methyltransferase/precorrin-2 dehydrogenase/sirohydrochlorin ferrochelatase